MFCEICLEFFFVNNYLQKNEVNRLMRFENEIEELKSMNNQLKNQIEQMSLELKEAATDEQKFQSQV